MQHPEKKTPRSFDMPGRSRKFTDLVYSGKYPDRAELTRRVFDSERDFDPPPPEYRLFCGEMHGHTNLSDGGPDADIDTYFKSIRDIAKLDFGALTDHDHGGIARAELWDDGKWQFIQEKIAEYYEPGKFTTLLAYERDSYPYFNNLVVYYRSGRGELLRGIRAGELTRQELETFLARKDLLIVPHDSYCLSAGCDFETLPLELIPPLLEIYSCSDCAEYFDHPLAKNSWCRGGAWQDALKKGAKMGVIGGSDDHMGTPGQNLMHTPYPGCYRGMTCVWATGNTREEIFDALAQRRCYACMGSERMSLDFRINGHYMGEEFSLAPEETREIWIDFDPGCDIQRVTLVKNCRDQIILYKRGKQLIFDYKQESDCDVYYVRAITADGRYCWSSPIWINRAATGGE